MTEVLCILIQEASAATTDHLLKDMASGVLHVGPEEPDGASVQHQRVCLSEKVLSTQQWLPAGASSRPGGPSGELATVKSSI